MDQRLSAQATVALQQPARVLSALCRSFEEHGAVALADRQATLEMAFGRARLLASETTLTLEAEGGDETEFSFLKWSLTETLLGSAKGEAPIVRWSGPDDTGKPLPFFREMRVDRVIDLTPRMRRVRLRGPHLTRFAGKGMHVRLLFARPGRAPAWPVSGADGRPQWPQGEDCPLVRIYTISAVDPAAGWVDIDMVLHEGSAPGADFARLAQPGTVVGMLGPSGDLPPPADFYLFLGDETALPAIRRALQMLPAGAMACVRIEVADEAEEQPLFSTATLDLAWLHRNGAAAGTTNLLIEAARAVAWPEGRHYAWAGCEYAAFKALRAFLRGERKLGREAHLVTAYWRRGSAPSTTQ
jgi:NADPH-dependent ferric siderophore reductase